MGSTWIACPRLLQSRFCGLLGDATWNGETLSLCAKSYGILKWHAWKGNNEFENHGGLPLVSHLSLRRLLSIIGNLESCHWNLILEMSRGRMYVFLISKLWVLPWQFTMQGCNFVFYVIYILFITRDFHPSIHLFNPSVNKSQNVISLLSTASEGYIVLYKYKRLFLINRNCTSLVSSLHIDFFLPR